MAKVDQKYVDGYVNMRIENVELRWAKVQEHQFDQYAPPGAPAGEKKWVTDILLDDKTAKSLKSAGFNVKSRDGQNYISASKKCFKNDGSPNRPVLIVGRDGRTLVTEELGNGTKVNIKLSARKWSTVKTITLYLDAIQVIDLVEFNGVSGFDSVDGDEDDNTRF